MIFCEFVPVELVDERYMNAPNADNLGDCRFC